VAAGTYDIYVRAPRSLANVRRDVVLTGGLDTLHMGALLTGNGVQTTDITSTADIVDATDFSIFAGSFFQGPDDTDWDERADYDADLFVGPFDFSLLASNFFVSGPRETP